MRDDDDAPLVAAMRAGDERAFEAFFDEYFPRLFRFALVRLDRRDDAAEDVVQAALSRAVAKLHTYRGEAALFTWLCTFCRHEISAHYRRQPPRARVELVEESPEVRAALESLLAAPAPGTSAALLREEVVRRVQVTLDALPRRYGDALSWKYLEGRSVAEIAQRLDVGAKAAESLLTRARGAFREAFRTMSLDLIDGEGETR